MEKGLRMNNSEALFFYIFKKWRKVNMKNVRETVLDDAKKAVCGEYGAESEDKE